MNRLTRSSSLSPLLLVALSLAAPISIADAAGEGQPATQPRQGSPAPVRDRTANIPPALGDNAALVYYSIWMNDNREQTAPFSDAYSDMQYGKALPKGVADYLELRKADINRMVRAGKMKHCDFGIDRSEGFNTLLPHLAKLRAVARTLNADAARCLLEGKPDDAADRFVAIFGLARHAATDRILISSLVGIAIANVPVDGLVDHKAAWQLTPAGRAKVLAAIEKFEGAAGFRLLDAIEGEREMAVNNTILKYEGPGAGRRFADEVLSMAVATTPVGPADAAASKEEHADLEKVRQMDGEQLQAEARKLNRFYDEVSKVWDAPGAHEKLKELATAAERGEYGPLGAFLLPSLTKCRTSQDKGVEALAKMATALRQADAEAAGAASEPAKGAK